MMAKQSPSDLHVVPVKTIALASAVSAHSAKMPRYKPFIGLRFGAEVPSRQIMKPLSRNPSPKYKDRTEREVGSRGSGRSPGHRRKSSFGVA